MEHLGLSDLNCEVEERESMSCDCDKECSKKEINTYLIQYAVKVLLLGLGEDINREGIKNTPLRVAKVLCDGTIGYKQSVKEIVDGALFPEAGLERSKDGHRGGVGGFVILRDLEFYSYCESCMLPFYFKCHVGYVPSGKRVLGVSKLSRVANMFAKRFQEPQRLADEVCSALYQEIQPAGVAVVIQCTHINFPDTETNLDSNDHKGLVEIVVSSGSGVFENKEANMWCDIFHLINIGKHKVHVKGSLDKDWCPSLSFKVAPKIEEINPIMVTAVSSILKALGEDPTRKELVGTPSRFVKWLMNFQYCPDIDVKLMRNLEENIDDKVNSVLNLRFWSQCEHHLLPFNGFVHIGYFISKGFHHVEEPLLQSIVQFYGFKLQVQERLTKQIAETISPMVGGSVIVVVKASHTCMISRGIEKFGSNTTTIAVLGRFSTDLAARSAFLESIPH